MALTPEKIHTEADKIAAQGERPTLARVRKALGGGSFSTISEAMQDWREQQTQEHALAEVEVPGPIRERVGQLQSAVWEAAIDEAERRLAAERESLAMAQESSESQVAEIKEVVETLEAEAKERNKEILALNEKLNDSHDRCQKNDSEIHRLNGEIVGLESKLSIAESESSVARQTMDETYDKLDNANYQWSSTRGELHNAEKTIKSLRSDLNEANRDLKKQRNENTNLHKKADSAQQLADDRKEVLDNAYKSHDKALNDLREDFKSRIQYIEEDAREAKKSLSECRNELSNSKKHIDKSNSIEKRVSSLEKENSKLKSKNRSGLSH